MLGFGKDFLRGFILFSIIIGDEAIISVTESEFFWLSFLVVILASVSYDACKTSHIERCFLFS